MDIQMALMVDTPLSMIILMVGSQAGLRKLDLD
jgi:hypothetical protein